MTVTSEDQTAQPDDGRSTTEGCPTHLLSDDPSATDELGSHERVANLLIQLFGDKPGGLAVALIGTYGAGKSTVVRLTGELLDKRRTKDAADTRLFVFNAWAHQGDPLRRSFLEELRDSFIKLHWVSKDTLAHEFGGLTQRVQTSTTTTSPSVTLAGGIVAGSFLGVPIGSALLAQCYYLWGTTLCLAPLLAFFGVWLYYRPWGLWKWPDFVTTTRSRLPFSELLWQKTHDTSKSTSVSSPEPTSVEFSKLYGDLVGKALSGNSARRLVIVLDNLDRLSGHDALRMMATMRTFVEHGEAWTSQLWLLVPFAPDWKSRLLSEQSKSADEGDLAETFLEKSFQIRVDLAEPPLSNWRRFLNAQLTKALPNHIVEFAKIATLYGRPSRATQRSLTPRALKQFVNRLAVSHQQWHDDIPLCTQAAFQMVNDQEIANWISQSGGVEILPIQDQSILEDPQWRGNFAALYYNLPPSEAAHALMESLVRTSLIDGDPEKLRDIRSTPGFEEVCDHIVASEGDAWASSAPETLALVAYTLSDLEITGPNTWYMLRRAEAAVQRWVLTGAKSGQGLVCIIDSYPEVAQATSAIRVLKLIGSPVVAENARSTKISALSEWLKALIPVFRRAHELEPKAAMDAVRVGNDPKDYIDIMVAADKLPEDMSDVATALKPAVASDGIMASLVERLRSDQEASDALRAILMMSKLEMEWPWKRWLDPIGSDLTAGQIPSGRAKQVVEALLILALRIRKKEVVERVKSFYTSGHIYNQAHQLITDTRVLAISLWFYLDFGPVVTHAGNSAQVQNRVEEIRNNPAGPNSVAVINELSNLISQFDGLTSRIERWRTTPANDKAAGALIEGALTRNDYNLGALPIPFMENYDYLRRVLQASYFDRLFKSIVKDPVFIDDVTKSQFSRGMAEFYCSVLDGQQAVNAALIEYLKEGTRAISRSDWEEELKQSGALVKLVTHLSQRDCKNWLDLDFQDALLSHAKSVLNSQTYPEPFADGWSFVVSAVNKDGRDVLLSDLLDDMLNRDDLGQRIFTLYGDLLLEGNTLEKADPDRIVRRLFRVLAGSTEVWALHWLKRALNTHPNVIRTAPASTQHDLVGRIREREGGDIGGDAKTELDEVVEILKRMGLMSGDPSDDLPESSA